MSGAFRDFIYRTWDIADRISEMVEAYAVSNSSCMSMTANYNKVGSSGESGGSCDAPLAHIADLKDRIETYKQMLVDAEKELTDFCALLNTRDAQILRYRYILRLPWGAILTAMQAKGYPCSNLRTLFYWHTDALSRAKIIWEENYAVANK